MTSYNGNKIKGTKNSEMSQRKYAAQLGHAAASVHAASIVFFNGFVTY
jgi:hypothetical protein